MVFWDSIETFFIHLLKDMIFVIFYVKTLDCSKVVTKKREIAAVLLLLVLNYLILVGDHIYYEALFWTFRVSVGHALVSFVRNFLIYGTYFLYIYLLKALPIKVIAYDSLLISASSLACHNIFLTPVTKPIVDASVTWFESSVFNHLLCYLILNGVTISLYYLAYKCILLKSSSQIDNLRIGLLSAMFLVSVYFNGSIKSIEFIDITYARQLSVYLIIVQFLLLACIGYFENYQRAAYAHAKAELENQSVTFLLQSIERQQKNEVFVQRLQHDLKNHLLAIRTLLQNHQPDKALAYIDNLSGEFFAYAPAIISGNALIDGICAQKIDLAEKKGINVSVSADFSYLDAMEKVDLCILFGNLLDNALEACSAVNDGSARFIHIRGKLVGESIVYSIENSFCGELFFSQGVPLTTKPDQRLHGIGLQSVQLVVEKYAGTIAFSAENHVFRVVCSFPLMRQPSEGE